MYMYVQACYDVHVNHGTVHDGRKGEGEREREGRDSFKGGEREEGGKGGRKERKERTRSLRKQTNTPVLTSAARSTRIRE